MTRYRVKAADGSTYTACDWRSVCAWMLRSLRSGVAVVDVTAEDAGQTMWGKP